MSISPGGRWVAVSAISHTMPGFRLFLLDLVSRRADEVELSPEARAQLTIEDRPGLQAGTWSDEGKFRFPAARVQPSSLRRNLQSLVVEAEPGVAVGPPSWLSLEIVDDRAGMLVLDATSLAADVSIPIPADVDPRLDVRLRSRAAFDLVDAERGGAILATFGSRWKDLYLLTADFSPDGAWIVVTIGHALFFSSGSSAYLIERESGSMVRFAGGRYFRTLKFRPKRRELFGICECGSSRQELYRWSY
jgi:hypothetical protein